MKISNIFRPKIVLTKIEDLDFNYLKKQGIRVLLVDIDNTLVPYYENYPDSKTKKFLALAKDNIFDVILVSNNNKKRVSEFAKNLGLPYYYFSLKPLSITYRKIMKKFNYQAKEIAMIGDQLLTDVVGANLLKIYSVLVEPLVEKDGIHTRINRKIEKMIRKKLKI